MNIQLPKKEADSQEVITITGLEEDAEAAKVDTLQPRGPFVFNLICFLIFSCSRAAPMLL